MKETHLLLLKCLLERQEPIGLLLQNWVSGRSHFCNLRLPCWYWCWQMPFLNSPSSLLAPGVMPHWEPHPSLCKGRASQSAKWITLPTSMPQQLLVDPQPPQGPTHPPVPHNIHSGCQPYHQCSAEARNPPQQEGPCISFRGHPSSA